MSGTGPTVDIGAAFADGRVVDEAMAEGYIEAARLHKQVGVPLVVWRNDRVTLIPPDEIVVPDHTGREAA
jgi:hypothetical protein